MSRKLCDSEVSNLAANEIAYFATLLQYLCHLLLNIALSIFVRLFFAINIIIRKNDTVRKVFLLTLVLCNICINLENQEVFQYLKFCVYFRKDVNIHFHREDRS